jgi:hypothetical protein
MAKKIHIVYDHDGKIIVASESKNHAKLTNMANLKMAEFEIPAKFEGKKMHEYIPHLMVDPKASNLKEQQKG